MERAKPTPIIVYKTDINNIIFELDKARTMYQNIHTQRASNRVYVITNLINKLKTKIS